MRRVKLPLLVIALSPSLAYADGLGGLSALRYVFYFVVAIFCAAWLILWIGLRVLGRFQTGSRPLSPPRRYWLWNVEIPLALRIVALAQYLLAFVYSFGSVMELIFPGLFHNSHIAESGQQKIYFGIAFALLALVSASGYVARSPTRGFRLGTWLGWLCVANAGASLLFREWLADIDWLSLLFGAILLLVLRRNQAWFGVTRSNGAYRRFIPAIAWTAGVFGGIAVLFVTASLLTTTVFPASEPAAREVLSEVAAGIGRHRERHGRWPTSLEQLDPAVDLNYRGNKVRYVPQTRELWLDVRIPTSPDPMYRMTFGWLSVHGPPEEISQVGMTIRD
jgi:hypothetical protein